MKNSILEATLGDSNLKIGPKKGEKKEIKIIFRIFIHFYFHFSFMFEFISICSLLIHNVFTLTASVYHSLTFPRHFCDFKIDSCLYFFIIPF